MQQFEGVHDICAMTKNFIACGDPNDYDSDGGAGWNARWEDDVDDTVVVDGRRWVLVGDHYFSYGKPTEAQEKNFQTHLRGVANEKINNRTKIAKRTYKS